MRPILLYGCETWPIRVADEMLLVAFGNDSLRGTEIAYQRQNCGGGVSVPPAFQLSSSKEGFVGLAMLQDVPAVN